MSNVWAYKLFIQAHYLSQEEIAKIIALADTHKFSIRDPDTVMISLERVDLESLEMQSTKSDDWTSSIEEINKPGTLLSLYQEDASLHLSFDSVGEGEKWSIETYHLKDTPFYGSISILINQSFLFTERSNEKSIAQNVKAFYGDLCTAMKAPYGYVADEYVLENYQNKMHLHDDIRLQCMPTMLFGINYFSNYCISTTANCLDIFSQLGAALEYLSSGVLVSFFEHSWQYDLRRVQEVNERWREMHEALTK